MSTKSETAADLINRLNVSTKKEGVGDFLVGQATRQGVHVPNAAAAPTQADFNNLLTSLRNAGLIASA